MCHTVRIVVHGADHIATVRNAVRDCVSDAYDDARDLSGDAAVVVSELATNSVQAHAVDVSVLAELHRRRVHVEVSDDAEGSPLLQPQSPDNVSGRGLAIVAALAETWGVSDHDTDRGKTVWADLAVGDGVTMTAGCRL